MAKIIVLGSSAAFPFPRTTTNRFTDYTDTAHYQPHFLLHTDSICQSAKKGGKDRRMRSSIALIVHGKTIIFDAGPDIRYQLKKFHLKPDAIFITHNHADATSGLRFIKTVPVFSEERKNIKPNIPVEVFGLRIVPFRVRHSATAPCVGYLIRHNRKTVAYLSDFVSLQGARTHLQKSDIAFVDGSILKKTRVGHLAIDRQLALYKKWRLKKAVFTHIGHDTLPHRDLVQYVQGRYKHADVAYDSMTIKL